MRVRIALERDGVGLARWLSCGLRCWVGLGGEIEADLVACLVRDTAGVQRDFHHLRQTRGGIVKDEEIEA